MRKVIIILNWFILFCLMHNLSIAQDNKLDSLRALYKKAKESSTPTDIEKESKLLSQIGTYYLYKGVLDSALSYYNQNIRLLGNSKKVSAMYCNIGAVYQKKGEYQLAVEYYHKAREVYEKYNDKDGICSVLNNLGSTYMQYKKFDDALRYLRQGLAVAISINDTLYISTSYSNIGTAYFEQKKYLDSADIYLKKALKFAELKKDKSAISIALENLGNVCDELKEFKAANTYFKAALKLKQEVGNKYSITVNTMNLGDLNMRFNQFDTAYQYFKEATRLSQEIGSKDLLKYSYQNMSELYERKADYKQAFIYYKLYSSVKDTIFNEKNNKQINMFKEKYEAEKKDKEIIAKNLEISNKNILIFKISAGALSVILIFLALFFSQRNKKNKLQKEKVEKEAEINRVSAESATLKNELSKANQRMLIRLMDPHSSSNNLSTIQRYILENDKQKANQMLTDFASLHRKIYEACQEDFIELEQELEIIETYLNIEKEHYAGRLETKLDIDKEIETDSLKILPMLIYPIVENAIIHGLRHKEGNEGLLQIKIGKKDDKNYTFVIEDNGIGRKQSAEINKHRKPTGLDNVKKRIEQTNKMSAYNYLFEIEDLYDKNNKPNGTRVKFHILLS